MNETEIDDLLPVMVFIHGGGWVCGSGNSLFYSPHFLMDKEIVYVSFNYRLGAIGILIFYKSRDGIGIKHKTK